MLEWIRKLYWARKLATSDQIATQRSAMECLAVYGLPGFRRIVSALDRSPDKPDTGWNGFSIQRNLIDAFVSFGSAAIPMLGELLHHPKIKAQEVAMIALAKLGDAANSDSIIAKLDNPRLVPDASWALGAMRCQKASPKLMELWRSGMRLSRYASDAPMKNISPRFCGQTVKPPLIF